MHIRLRLCKDLFEVRRKPITNALYSVFFCRCSLCFCLAYACDTAVALDILNVLSKAIKFKQFTHCVRVLTANPISIFIDVAVMKYKILLALKLPIVIVFTKLWFI